MNINITENMKDEIRQYPTMTAHEIVKMFIETNNLSILKRSIRVLEILEEKELEECYEIYENEVKE